jgi:ABC-type multidrug transport system ATPase subunit
VADITFTLEQNEIMGILGPSGAGKSSIFKMVTLAMSRTDGYLELLGHNFSEKSAHQNLT